MSLCSDPKHRGVLTCLLCAVDELGPLVAIIAGLSAERDRLIEALRGECSTHEPPNILDDPDAGCDCESHRLLAELEGGRP